MSEAPEPVQLNLAGEIYEATDHSHYIDMSANGTSLPVFPGGIFTLGCGRMVRFDELRKIIKTKKELLKAPLN